MSSTRYYAQQGLSKHDTLLIVLEYSKSFSAWHSRQEYSIMKTAVHHWKGHILEKRLTKTRFFE